MRWEQVPQISLFKNNTAPFVHDLPAAAISNAAGETNYPTLPARTWVRITEAPEGGWGIDGHANTGDDIVVGPTRALLPRDP
jgi:hypothetical protein